MDLQESYKILELEKTSSLQEVKQAYRDMVFIWHPDRLESNARIKKKAEKKLQGLNLAYEILQNHLSGKLPDFSKIIITPESAELKYHESKVFTVFGIDGKGKKTQIERVKWESSGGAIYQDGLFFADDKVGNYKITAHFGTLCAQAKIKLIASEAEQVSKSPSLGQKLGHKLHQYWQNHPLAHALASLKRSILQLLVMFKLALWGLLSWFIMTNNHLYEPTTNFSARFASILFLCWVVGLISPNLVPNFGITTLDSASQLDSKAKVGVFYSVLTTIFFGIALATSPLPPLEHLNSLQNWILGVSGITTVFTLSYPQGSPMASMLNKAPKQNRFTASSGCLLMGLFFILIIALFR